jgi:hypothetical protein
MRGPGLCCSLSVDIDMNRLRYRACLQLQGDATEYDELSLSGTFNGVPSACLEVKDSSGQLIHLSKISGTDWCPAAFVSTIFPERSFKPALPGITCGDWLDLAVMLDGFKRYSSSEPEAWASVKISLSVATRAEGWQRSASANPEAGFSYVSGESAWVELIKK